MRRPVHLKYLSQSGNWPSGNPRMYYRAPFKKPVAMPDAPMNSPYFLRTYAELADKPIPKVARHASKGSIARAVADFQTSTHFAARAASTRAVWGRMLRDIADKYGEGRFADLRTIHIRKDLARLGPHPANNRLKVWRGLCQWAYETGMIEEDPSRQVKKHRTPKSDGHTPWTRDDVAAFRAHWPRNSLQRMCFELMHWTTCSIGDAARMKRTQIDADGWLVYERQKTKTIAGCQIYAPAPAWAESPAELLATMDAQPSKHVQFVVTVYGKPRSPKAAASWFSRACTDAGLPELSAHGIRKHRSAVFKENGAPREHRMAWMGHETEEEASRYSRSADLKKTLSVDGVEDQSSNLIQMPQKNQ